MLASKYLLDVYKIQYHSFGKSMYNNVFNLQKKTFTNLNLT